MKKKKHKNYASSLEHFRMSWIDSLFSPTISMAAELMNVPVNAVEEWLAKEHLEIVENDRLSEAAIDFLAKKYASRIHKYFDNCKTSWDTLDIKERQLFSQFKRKYGKFYRIRINEWKDIEVQHIIRDFKEELKQKGRDAYFEQFEPFSFPTIIVSSAEDVSDFSFSGDLVPRERGILLYAISHSLYYGSRIKTKIPARPGHRNIILEILQQNRFHIFTGESEDNVPIDAIKIPINQPQLAIVPVFGYRRHKNKYFHEKTQINFSRPSQRLA